MPTHYRYLRCGDLRSPGHGAAQRFTHGLRNDDDDDDDDDDDEG